MVLFFAKSVKRERYVRKKNEKLFDTLIIEHKKLRNLFHIKQNKRG